MVDAFGLMILERRQLGHGRGLGFIKNSFGQGLQFAPAGPVQIGGVSNLPEKAAPFDNDSVDIARPEEVGDPSVFV